VFQRSFWSLSLAATIVMVSSSTSYGVPYTTVIVQVLKKMEAANKENHQFKNYITKIGTEEFNTQLNKAISQIKDRKLREKVTEHFIGFPRFSSGIRDMSVGVGVGSVYAGKSVYDVCNVDKATREQCAKLLIRWYNKCNSNSNSNRKFQIKKETDCPKMN
jgi:sulfite reductase beta subunit-like hemoprotein